MTTEKSIQERVMEKLDKEWTDILIKKSKGNLLDFEIFIREKCIELTEQLVREDLKKVLDDFEKKWYFISEEHYGKGYISCKHEKKFTNDIIIEWKELRRRLGI